MYSTKSCIMIEYIYNIIKILSAFEFKVLEYAQDGGLQMTSAAQQYYCSATGRSCISDNEVKEIARFMRYRYIDKCKSNLWDTLSLMTEGAQQFEAEIEDVHLVITADIRSNQIELSIESPFNVRISISDEDPNTSFLFHTTTGRMANEIAKERVSEGIADLLLHFSKPGSIL